MIERKKQKHLNLIVLCIVGMMLFPFHSEANSHLSSIDEVQQSRRTVSGLW